MSPANAILLTLLLPGSAHAVLGKPVRAAVAMLTCVGLFFAGWAILGDRLFHGVLFEPFAILANVALLVLDHYPAGATWETFMELANLMCLLVFTAEITLKVGAYSLFGFLSTGWNQMDMFVVVGSWASKRRRGSQHVNAERSKDRAPTQNNGRVRLPGWWYPIT